ncbi:MAG: hypothetical protein ACRC6M_11040 [Microcystaceae cyanobacterium]
MAIAFWDMEVRSLSGNVGVRSRFHYQLFIINYQLKGRSHFQCKLSINRRSLLPKSVLKCVEIVFSIKP